MVKTFTRKQPKDNFEKRFLKIATSLESFLIKLVVVSFSLVLISQALLSDDETRRFLSYVDRLEGSSVNMVLSEALSYQLADDTHAVRVMLINQKQAEKAWLLINGRRVVDFSYPEVTVLVKNGDLIEIDGQNYNEPLQFRIVQVSEELLYPKEGEEVIVTSNIGSFTRIQGR